MHTARVATRAQKTERWVPGPASMATTQYRELTISISAMRREMPA